MPQRLEALGKGLLDLEGEITGRKTTKTPGKAGRCHTQAFGGLLVDPAGGTEAGLCVVPRGV